MKKFIALCLTGVMLVSSPIAAFAEGIIYNGSAITYSSQQPVIIDSRTYVPIRDVFEALGFEVDWDETTKIVSISNDYYQVMLTTGTSKMFVVDVSMNISAKKLENTVKLINGRTMLPLREILEAMNYSLAWDDATKTTTITDGNDYAYLNGFKERMENLDAEDDEDLFKVDPTKPTGTLTAEEKAYIIDCLSCLDGDKYEAIYGDVDADDMSPEELKSFINTVYGQMRKDIEALSCPESLKAVDEAVLQHLGNIAERTSNTVQALSLIEGEVDSVQAGLGFAMTMVAAGGLAVEYIDIMEAFSDFFEENNIDIEEQFGDDFDLEDLGDMIG